MPMLNTVASNASDHGKTTYKTYTSPRISPLHSFDQIVKDQKRKNFSEFPSFIQQKNKGKRYNFSSNLNDFPEVIEEDKKEEEK